MFLLGFSQCMAILNHSVRETWGHVRFTFLLTTNRMSYIHVHWYRSADMCFITLRAVCCVLTFCQYDLDWLISVNTRMDLSKPRCLSTRTCIGKTLLITITYPVDVVVWSNNFRKVNSECHVSFCTGHFVMVPSHFIPIDEQF